MRDRIHEVIPRSIVAANPFLGIASAVAIISAAVFIRPSDDNLYCRRVIWALVVTVPPAWFALEWSYRFSDSEKQDEKQRAAIGHTQELYSKFWVAAATGIALLYFGDDTLVKLAKVLGALKAQ